MPLGAWGAVRGRRLQRWGGFYGELCSTDDSFIREQIDGRDFDGVAAGQQCINGNEAFDSDLLASFMKMICGFDSTPDFLLIFSNSVSDGDAGLVRDLVQFQIVELKKDAKPFRAGKLLIQAGTDFVRIQHELADTSLGRGDFLDLVSEDQGAGIELVVFKMGDAKRGVEDPKIAADSVLDDEVKTIEARAEGDRFLVDGREV